MKKWLIVILAVLVIVPLFTGCEGRSDDEYAEYVSVEVYSYTRYFVDVYIGNAFEERLAPGEYGWYSKDLYDDEKFRLNFIIWKSSGPIEIKTSFDNDLDDYHINIYDDWVESY
jgi:hypothetical protein